MAKKKIYLDDKKRKELEGFEEVLDLIDANKAEIKSDKNQQIEDYEIYDFLEKENLRLEKLDHFFTTHLPIDKRYSQTKKLIEKEKKDVTLLREELIQEFIKSDSPLFKYLADIYKGAF